MMASNKQCLCLAALLLMSSAANAADKSFGRLFTTKSQRASLNAMRAHEGAARVTKPPIQGYVERSDGVVTWWLENQPIPQHSDVVAKHAQKQ